MKPLRILACDDEPLALMRLAELLDVRDDVELVASLLDAREALPAIAALRPDVLLLDIEMPKLRGFDIIDALRAAGTDLTTYCPQVVIVSAHPELAAEAFEAEVLDFLAKPVRYARLDTALSRARERIETMSAAQRLETLTEELSSLKQRSHAARAESPAIWIRQGEALEKIGVDSIDYIRAEGAHVRLVGRDINCVHRVPLSKAVSDLETGGFLQVHRSAAVRLDAVKSLIRTIGGLRVRLFSGVELSIGRRYRRAFELQYGARTTPT